MKSVIDFRLMLLNSKFLEESKDSCEKKDVSSDGTASGNHFNATFQVVEIGKIFNH